MPQETYDTISPVGNSSPRTEKRKTMKGLTINGVVLLMVFLSGCQMYTAPRIPPPKLTPAEKNFQSLWEATQDTLRRYNFTLDRRDRRAGIITTEPMTGKQFFEFWRADAVTLYDIAESSIQTIYRITEVTIAPTDEDGDTFTPTVKVYAFRSARETQEVTSTSEAYNLFFLPSGFGRVPGSLLLDFKKTDMFSQSEEPGPRLGASGIKTSPEWLVPVGEDGRDRNLERVLTAKIKRAAARKSS